MKKLLPTIFVVFTIDFYILNFFFAWINTTIDSVFHWSFAEFIRTGIYPPIQSFWYLKPTTVEPPLYSLLLLLLQSISSRADILLHGFQIIILGITAFLVYKITSLYIGKSAAKITACLFALIPGNIVFVSYIMTEIGAQLGITLFVYLVYQFVKTKKNSFIALATFLGFLLGIYRYSYVVFGMVSLVIFLFSRKKRIIEYIFPMLGIGIIIIWIFINHAITGVWGLSDTKNIQLWNQVIWEGKMLPSENTPEMKELRKYVPPERDLYQALWVIEFDILPYVNRDWVETSDIMGKVAVAAIKEHPIEYLFNTADIFIRMHHAGRPYWHNLSRFGNDDPNQPLLCDRLGNIKLCSPIIQTPYSYTLWNTFILASDWFYETLFPLLCLWVFLPSLFIVLLFGDMPKRTLALLYLVGTIPIAAYVHVDARYLIAFYPLMTMITVIACSMIYMRYKGKKK